ncbi:Glycosyltransferase 2-like [uncultured Caudovirales phage]|uniref:Glycosyltransferase 2-like n=1 Tax=uncultured Caudovirales phage TaxID=2100421 RepID=A0A6J5NSL9_9CAUD|nr:Glycosyltransferase 2-like [uncultured Caudovirales phage]
MIVRPHICLNAIVKNEAASIRPWLESVVDHIDSWVIMDTGSTDNTKEEIETFFDERGIFGALVDREFGDFSAARNEAVRLAEHWLLPRLGWPTHLLLMDADMRLVTTSDPWLAGHTRDIGLMQVREPDGTTYWTPRLRRVGCDLWYSGVTHEVLDMPMDRTTKILGASIEHLANGTNRADKYERDIRLLKAAIAANPNDARAWFYLGQSYMGLQDWDAAKSCFYTRSQMGGWDEEVWFSELQAARCCYQRIGPCFRGGDAIAVAVSRTLEAYDARPTRAEPLADLVGYMIEAGNLNAAALFRDKIRDIPMPEDLLFVDPAAYDLPYRHDWNNAVTAKHWATAEITAGACALRHRGDPGFWYHAWAKALWENGHRAKAIATAETGLRLCPDRATLEADLAVMRGLVDGKITPS